SSTALSTGESTEGAGSGVTRGGAGGGDGGRGADGRGRRGSGAGGTARGGATGSGAGAVRAGSSAGDASTTGTGAAGAAFTPSVGDGLNQPLIVAHPVRPRQAASTSGRSLTVRSEAEAGPSSWCPSLFRFARRWSHRAFVRSGTRSRARCRCLRVGSYNTARTSAPHPPVTF